MVLMVNRTARAVTPKLGKWLQEIPGKTFKIFSQKSAVMGVAKILCKTFKLPGHELEGNWNTHRV